MKNSKEKVSKLNYRKNNINKSLIIKQKIEKHILYPSTMKDH